MIGRRIYPLGLNPELVDQIVVKVVADMRQYGNWPELDQEAGPAPNWVGPTSDH
jgi:hypothetical protein